MKKLRDRNDLNSTVVTTEVRQHDNQGRAARI